MVAPIPITVEEHREIREPVRRIPANVTPLEVRLQEFQRNVTRVVDRYGAPDYVKAGTNPDVVVTAVKLSKETRRRVERAAYASQAELDALGEPRRLHTMRGLKNLRSTLNRAMERLPTEDRVVARVPFCHTANQETSDMTRRDRSPLRRDGADRNVSTTPDEMRRCRCIAQRIKTEN